VLVYIFSKGKSSKTTFSAIFSSQYVFLFVEKAQVSTEMLKGRKGKIKFFVA